MSLKVFAAMFLATLAATAASAPVPELRVEATDGGSVFHIKNVSAQPLTAFLIELVGYPGSSYSLWRDEVASAPVAPGDERHIPVTNMTVGAAPEYVKLQAALYADGSTSGVPEKVAQMVERRRVVLATTRELIRRLEMAQSSGTGKTALLDELAKWADSLTSVAKSGRNSQAAINQAAARGLIVDAAGGLDTRSLDETLARLRASERALASSKPAL